MCRFTLVHDVIAEVTFTDDLRGYDVNFPQKLKWLPTGFSSMSVNCDLPMTQESLKEDLNKQVEIWYNDWITTGEPWD